MAQVSRDNVKIEFAPSFYILSAILLIAFPVKVVTAWFAASLLHELAHILILFIFHIKISGISVRASGFVINTPPMSNKEETLCAFSGPLVSLLLVLFFRYYPLFSLCGLIQFIANMLPIGQRDGARGLCCICIKLLGERTGERVFVIIQQVVRGSLFCVIVVASLYTRIWLILLFAVPLFAFGGKIPCKHRRQIVQ